VSTTELWKMVASSLAQATAGEVNEGAQGKRSPKTVAANSS